MRVDFREERRWKIALAFSLAHAVMAWHEAGSLEERVNRGICVIFDLNHQKVRMGRPRLYHTVEEKAKANRLKSKRYYDKSFILSWCLYLLNNSSKQQSQSNLKETS